METKSIDELKPDPRNPRTMSDHDAKALKNSITNFGDISCIVFNVRTKQLVGGHQRLEIMRRLPADRQVKISQRYEQPDETGTVALGYVYIGNKPFAYREVDWDEPTQHAANIAANRIQGEFNLDMLAEINYELNQLENGAELLALTGQTPAEVSDLLDAVGANGDSDQDDEAPELDTTQPAISKPGEIYQLGPHRLLCGDSTDAAQQAKLLNGAKVAMIFTDPPYGLGGYGGRNDMDLQGDDQDVLKFYECIPTNVPEIYIWGNYKNLMNHLQGEPRDVIVWVKNNFGLGHGYRGQYELCFYYGKFAGSDSDVWEVKKDSNYTHPTQKPVELAVRAMRNSSQRGEVVLDLYGGSGSTLIACDKLERLCYMMEVDPAYCDVIRKRYAAHTGKDDWQAATPVIA